MVATAMADLPNPPASAVGNLKETETCTEGSDAILEAIARNGQVDDTAAFANAETASTVTAANNWATGPGLSLKKGTMENEIDRHCKIRFVERLSSVTSTICDDASANTDAGADAGDVTVPMLCEAQLNMMEDDRLDSVLDGLLVRVAESLVEMSTSSYEVQEDLNCPDKSGFTLLHYAALYNLQSLVPLLLSKGSNPDTPTARGKLTPLHLACGAGNWAIVELLVRNGCAVQVSDSFCSSPIDHARRNGFPEIAQWLTEKTGADQQKMAEWRALDEKRHNGLMELDHES
mmetsp:Transcript_48782/g.146986  ORF Transcript_48782/g.146986 Transcript_48782/m.146986 type:complete len:290 (-) Transcript_48782:804-1673(-)